MTLKNKLESHIRGWLPQEPILYTLKSTKDKANFDRWALCPFLVPGALMIFAALLSALFGLTLMAAYLPESLQGADKVFYSGLYVGTLSVGAFVLGYSQAAYYWQKNGSQ